MRLLVVMLLGSSLPWAQTPQDIAAGRQTFRSHCSPCHGYNGEGAVGPSLASGKFYHGSSDDDLVNIISDGIGGTDMPGLFYSPDRIRQIVAYIRSLSATPRTPPAGDPASGRTVYAARGCSNCHRVQGEGGWMGPDLTTIGAMRAASYLRESVLEPNAMVAPRYWVVTAEAADGRHYSAFLLNEDTYTVQLLDFSGQLHSVPKASLREYRVDKVSKMPSYKGVLSDREITDLVAFLASLRPSGADK